MDVSSNRQVSSFIRVKIPRKKMLASAVLDTGNSFDDVCSKQFAVSCGVRVEELQVLDRSKGCPYAVDGKQLTLLGRMPELEFFIEGIPAKFKFRPVVLDNLTADLNIGAHTLQENNISLITSHQIMHVAHGEHQVPLRRTRKVLEPLFSIDQRFAPVLNYVSKFETTEAQNRVQGLYFSGCHLLPMDLTLVGQNVVATMDHLIPPECGKWISVRGEHPWQGDGVFFPFQTEDEGKNYLTSHELIGGRNLTLWDSGKSHVFLLNCSGQEQPIQEGALLGRMYPCTEAEGKAEIATLTEGRSLPPQTMSQKREFIRKSFNLDENPILREAGLVQKAEDALVENFTAIAQHDSDYGCAPGFQFHIDLQPGTQPILDKVRPLNPAQKDSLRAQIKAWEQAEVITPAQSPWGAALVPVRKKNGKIRWCIDYRRLNNQTVKDSFPLPNIRENLESLSGSAVFSAIDNTGAYHAMKIRPDSQDITTFVSPLGAYKFTRLPFGLANAPAAYARMIESLLANLGSREYTLAYLDDLLIMSKTPEEHLSHVRKVLQLYAENGLKINPEKSFLFQRKVTYLGHVVEEGRISMVPSYVDRILDWPTPQTGKDLSSFLGFCGYYAAFIPAYTQLTAKLHPLKKLPSKLPWTEELQQDLGKLKEAFKNAPTWVFPDFSPEAGPFILTTDFSSRGISGILSQEQNGQERFIGCMGKTLNRHQKNYGSVKGELWALHLALFHFRHILRFKRFIIRTDSQAIALAKGFEDESGGARRWIERLQSFDADIVHIKGKDNIMADAISRRTDLPEMDPWEEREAQDEADTICALEGAPTQTDHEQSGTDIEVELEDPLTIGANSFKKIQEKDLEIERVKKWILHKNWP